MLWAFFVWNAEGSNETLVIDNLGMRQVCLFLEFLFNISLVATH